MRTSGSGSRNWSLREQGRGIQVVQIQTLLAHGMHQWWETSWVERRHEEKIESDAKVLLSGSQVMVVLKFWVSRIGCRSERAPQVLSFSGGLVLGLSGTA